MDEELLARVRGCYGAVRVRDLQPSRSERRHLAELVREGALTKHPHGVISIPGTETAIVLARVHGGLLTCQSAASYYGLPLPAENQCLHLAVPRGRLLPPLEREVVHVEGRLESPSPTEFPVAPLPQALARYLRCAPEASAPIMACDAALHAEQVSRAQVAELLQGPGSVGALRRLGRTSSRSRSPLETLARLQLEDAGLRVLDGVGIRGVGEVDLLVDGILIVELDGYTFHSDRHQFAKDRWRDRELLRRRLPVARFTRADVLGGRVAREVPALLQSIRMSRLMTNTPKPARRPI